MVQRLVSRQGFIQAVLLLSVFERRLSFEMLLCEKQSQNCQ